MGFRSLLGVIVLLFSLSAQAQESALSPELRSLPSEITFTHQGFTSQERTQLTNEMFVLYERVAGCRYLTQYRPDLQRDVLNYIRSSQLHFVKDSSTSQYECGHTYTLYPVFVINRIYLTSNAFDFGCNVLWSTLFHEIIHLQRPQYSENRVHALESKCVSQYAYRGFRPPSP